jgi:hypothetical protein
MEQITYIFLTDEGFTYEPAFKEKPAKVIENLQVIGYAAGSNAEEAFTHLLKTNSYLSETSFINIFSYPLKDTDYEKTREYHSMKNNACI